MHQGRCYIVGDNLDTDQIIPAMHLSIPLHDPVCRRRYGALALSGVPKAGAGLPEGSVPFIDPRTGRSPYTILVAGRNFGCGSSREHAPIALYEAGIRAVIARSYARIFFRNAVDGGYFPPIECAANLTTLLRTGDDLNIDMHASAVTRGKDSFDLLPLGAAAEIIAAGGIFAYARGLGKL